MSLSIGNNVFDFYGKSKIISVFLFFLFSSAIYSQCSVFTLNADFELPRVSTSGQNVDQSSIPGWKTTASDCNIEFWTNSSLGGFAYSGVQFVELNANQSSGLYQDYNTSVAIYFTYSFWHRGRLGVDKMSLKAGAPGRHYTIIANAMTGNRTWQEYTGNYKVPIGQTITRFIFESVSTSTGNPTVGNFLDLIDFKATIAPPLEDNLNIKDIWAESKTTLNVTEVYGNIIKWYNAANNLVYTGTSFVTPALNVDTEYYVKRFDVNDCSSAKLVIKVKVNPTATVAAVADKTICNGGSIDRIAFTGGVTGTTYTWVNDNSSIGLGASGTGDIGSFLGVNAGSTAVRSNIKVTPTTNYCGATPLTFSITVNPLPVVVTADLEKIICSGESSNINLSSSLLDEITYSWRVFLKILLEL